MTQDDDRRGVVMRRRVLLGGAAGGAAFMLLGDRALGQTPGAPGSVAEFVAWQESVFAAAERHGGLGEAERMVIQLLRTINATAVAGAPAPATTVPVATVVPVTSTTGGPPAPGVNRVLADGESFPDGFTVPAGETWAFAPGAKVRAGGNVVVEGTLRMHQPDPAQQQRLTFVDVDPSGFEGGDTHTAIAQDVGLWVVDDGRLDLQGAPKRSWTRLAGGAPAGTVDLQVHDAIGWRSGDVVVVTATAPRSARDAAARFDQRTIVAIDGSRVTVDRPLSHDHPMVDGRMTAEVLNLSRSVVIEGSPGREAHVISLHQGAHASQAVPWAVKHVELRHLGPAETDDSGRPLNGIGGRYPLHLHHAGDALAGLVVEGVAAHDCPNHVFVAHDANNVTFRECVAHQSLDTPYWWDPGELSVGVVYDRCVAHRAVAPASGDGRYKTTGFFAGHTTNDQRSKMLGCVAAAIEGGDASGFFWDNGSSGVWEFVENLAHHVSGFGVRVWQNSDEPHPLRNTFVYRSGGGASHGAYSNGYRYLGAEFHDCGTGIYLTAVSRGTASEPQCWHAVKVTGCDTQMVVRDAPVPSAFPTDVRRLSGVTSVVVESTHSEAHHWDFSDCGLPPSAFTVRKRSGRFRLRTQDGGQAWQLGATGGWQPIPPF